MARGKGKKGWARSGDGGGRGGKKGENESIEVKGKGSKGTVIVNEGDCKYSKA